MMIRLGDRMADFKNFIGQARTQVGKGVEFKRLMSKKAYIRHSAETSTRRVRVFDQGQCAECRLYSKEAIL